MNLREVKFRDAVRLPGTGNTAELSIRMPRVGVTSLEWDGSTVVVVGDGETVLVPLTNVAYMAGPAQAPLQPGEKPNLLGQTARALPNAGRRR